MADQYTMSNSPHWASQTVCLMDCFRKPLLPEVIGYTDEKISDVYPDAMKIEQPFNDVYNGHKGQGGLEPEHRSAVDSKAMSDLLQYGGPVLWLQAALESTADAFEWPDVPSESGNSLETR